MPLLAILYVVVLMVAVTASVRLQRRAYAPRLIIWGEIMSGLAMIVSFLAYWAPVIAEPIGAWLIAFVAYSVAWESATLARNIEMVEFEPGTTKREKQLVINISLALAFITLAPAWYFGASAAFRG
jgi:uncharacterized membrane protein